MNRLLAQLTTEVWAMHRPAFAAIVNQLKSMNLPPDTSLFGPPTAEQRAVIEARSAVREVEAATRRGPKSGTVAVVPVHGPIVYRDSLFSFLFGGVSVERLTQTIRDLSGNDTISAILLDIDSPGGTSAGLTELAAALREARDAKNVVAVANPTMASAAYWIGCQADEIIAPEVSMTGSVGCYIYHEDWSKAYADMGIQPTYVYKPEYKVEGNQEEPLTDEARAEMQRIVDEVYNLFVNDVAAGRKLTASDVTDSFGKGRALMGRDAKAAKMIDRIGTFNDTLNRLVGSRGSAGVVAEGNTYVVGEKQPELFIPAMDKSAAEAEQFVADMAALTEQQPPDEPDDPPPSDEAKMRTLRHRVAVL